VNQIRSFTSARFRQIQVEELEQMLTDSFHSAINDITAAILGGYSPEQAIELILLGGSVRRENVTSGSGLAEATCFVVTDSTGQTVAPKDDPSKLQGTGDSEECQDLIKDRAAGEKSEGEADAQGEAGTSTSSMPPPPFPWTYEGAVSFHTSVSTDFGARDTADYRSERPMTIILQADGTLDGILGGASIASSAIWCQEGTKPQGSFSTKQVDVPPVELSGTHNGGTFTIVYFVPGFPDIEGTNTLQEIDAYWEDSRSFTVCDGAGTETRQTTASFNLVRTEPPPS